MYLGFFFVHWSEGKVKQVYQSDPEPIEKCPFCNQASDVIYKIYNSNTKHYNAFTMGKGSFSATFTCRNCTTEGDLPKNEGDILIYQYQANIKFEKIIKLYETDPVKAKHKLEDLIDKNRTKNIDLQYMNETYNEWEKQLPSS